MEKAVVGWPRWTDKCVFSGGSWNATYPVTNLGIEPLAQVARSSGLTLAATQFTATLDKQRGVRALALVRHNLSLTAKLRVRIWSDAAKTVQVYDSGSQPVWGAVFPPDALEWEDDNWWSGTYTAEDLTGTTFTTPIWLGALFQARVIQAEIDDTLNPAGFVDVGMFEVAKGWQLSINPSYGASEGYRHRSQEIEALGGVKNFERRDKPRIWRGTVNLPRDEALAKGLEHLRQADTTIPFLWFPFPDEPQHWIRTVFLARNINPGLSSYATAGRGELPIAVEEVL